MGRHNCLWALFGPNPTSTSLMWAGFDKNTIKVLLFFWVLFHCRTPPLLLGVSGGFVIKKRHLVPGMSQIPAE